MYYILIQHFYKGEISPSVCSVKRPSNNPALNINKGKKVQTAIQQDLFDNEPSHKTPSAHQTRIRNQLFRHLRKY